MVPPSAHEVRTSHVEGKGRRFWEHVDFISGVSPLNPTKQQTLFLEQIQKKRELNTGPVHIWYQHPS